MSSIYKFEREIMLSGENIHVRRDTASPGFKKHWHNYYEIIVYIDCFGLCNLNGQDYDIKGKCLFLLTPKDFHQISMDADSSSSTIVIAFTENAVDSTLVDKITENAVVMYNIPAFVTDLAHMMWRTFEGDAPYRRQQLEHMLNCLLIEILHNGTSAGQSTTELNPVVRSAISYILTNPSGDLSLETMARRVGLSRAYFSTIFKSSTGISYKKYVTTIRIEHAKRLLEDGRLSVLEVGLESGFNTPSQFIRMFKAAVGDTPSGYKMKKR